MDWRGWLAALGLGGFALLLVRPLAGSGASLGVRAIARARSQLGVTEATGNNDGPEIAKYFAGATRIVNGQEKPTGWAPGWEWCAAFASWCAFDARLNDEPMPHGWRIAVWELVRDAKALGTWREWTPTMPNGPRPGDLVVYRRTGGDPRQPGQQGHVSRCVDWNGSTLRTIGGNENNSVVEHTNLSRMGSIVGFIAYPERAS